MKKSRFATRILKVQYRHVTRAKSHVVFFPEINLSGKWLQDCGFEIGHHVEISTERRKITITLAWPDNEM